MTIFQLSASFITYSSRENSTTLAIFAITQGVLCDQVIDLHNILSCSSFLTSASLLEKGEVITQLLDLLIILKEV